MQYNGDKNTSRFNCFHQNQTTLVINKINFFYLYLKITLLWWQKMLHISQNHTIMMIKKIPAFLFFSRNFPNILIFPSKSPYYDDQKNQKIWLFYNFKLLHHSRVILGTKLKIEIFLITIVFWFWPKKQNFVFFWSSL